MGVKFQRAHSEERFQSRLASAFTLKVLGIWLRSRRMRTAAKYGRSALTVPFSSTSQLRSRDSMRWASSSEGKLWCSAPLDSRYCRVRAWYES